MKRLCTFSIVVMSFKRKGFHTTLQYSKIGLTYTIKALTNDNKSRDIKQRIIRFARLCCKFVAAQL